MKKYFPLLIVCTAFVACQPFRLTRKGYENLRQTTDTACPLKIIEPGSGIPVGEKIGRLEIEPRIGKTGRNKYAAMSIAKREACAVNATTLYIVQEYFAGGDSSARYACIIDLYRETRKSPVVPDFVKRAQAESKAAREQRDRMEDVPRKNIDTSALVPSALPPNIDSLATTSLRRYKQADTLQAAVQTDSAAHASPHKVPDANTVAQIPNESAREREKLKKGVFATVGHHYGGATVAGIELEAAIWRIGMFGGVGVYGYAYGLHYHLRPDPLSSSISCLYWQNGLGDYERQTVAGAAYNYRGKRWLAMQIGLGKILSKGSEFNYFNDDLLIIYSIGAYVPF